MLPLTSLRLKFVHEFRDRQGVLRRYFRRHGKRIPLPGLPGSEEFSDAYKAALGGPETRAPIGAARTLPGTIGAAVAAYFNSAGFISLSESTQATYRGIIEGLRDKHGDKRLATLERRHVEHMMGEKGQKLTAANNLLRMLRMLMRFAISVDMVKTDPTLGVRTNRIRSTGFYTWTETDIEAFEAKHVIGTKPRLAMALMLYSAQRRGDIVGLGPQHIKGGTLTVRQKKTGALVEIPVHAKLAEIIQATPSGNLTFLVTSFGKPFTAAGFGNLFREWCDDAGLSKCTSHGLRKAASRRLAEAGCTPHEIMSITGHKTLKEVTRYTEAADRVRMGKTAMEKISGT